LARRLAVGLEQARACHQDARVVPAVAEANDPKKPSLSRWKLTLPHRSLPVIGLSCTPLTAVFKRNTLVYEMVTDDRGNEIRRTLGEAEWIQTPDMKEPSLHEKYMGSRTSNILFWTALSLAVIVLFLIISRLLPKNPQQSP